MENQILEKATETPKFRNEVVFKDGHTEEITWYERRSEKSINFSTVSGNYRYIEDSKGVNHEFQKADDRGVFDTDDTIDYLAWNPDDINTAVEENITTVATTIKDSGARREFETGAVRDIQEGKGRCDLMPLDVVGHLLCSPTLAYIYKFQLHSDVNALYDALTSSGVYHDIHTTLLETAKQFEDGAKKYGEYNWQKGIPTHCYIDSAVRHYLKHLRGDTDEPHDRAFCWNILCCIWTCIHKPELNDYAKKENT